MRPYFPYRHDPGTARTNEYGVALTPGLAGLNNWRNASRFRDAELQSAANVPTPQAFAAAAIQGPNSVRRVTRGAVPNRRQELPPWRR